ncbi:MAG: hypothetical protein CL782_03200 [Chloroflexi bacterium]|nr:hypothetical protein [Chloroflexota bacterium]
MKKVSKFKSISVSLFFSSILVMLIACSGPQGPAGDQGPQGLPGNPGAPGAQGPAGPSSSGDFAQISSSATIVISKNSLTMSEPFDVHGSGFISGEPVMISLQIDSSLAPVVGDGSSAQVVANGAGAFSVSFDSMTTNSDIISRASGITTLIAEGGQGNSASVPVTIIENFKSAASVSSTLVATPVESGEASAIYGSGFISGEIISISANGKVLAGATANSDGAFNIDVTVTLEEGLYSMMAIGSKGSEATAPLLVSSK